MYDYRNGQRNDSTIVEFQKIKRIFSKFYLVSFIHLKYSWFCSDLAQRRRDLNDVIIFRVIFGNIFSKAPVICKKYCNVLLVSFP